MSRHQKTIVVEHEGQFYATDQQVGVILFHALKDDGLVRNGDYKVKESVNVAGEYTKYVLEVDADPIEKTETKSATKSKE